MNNSRVIHKTYTINDIFHLFNENHNIELISKNFQYSTFGTTKESFFEEYKCEYYFGYISSFEDYEYIETAIFIDKSDKSLIKNRNESINEKQIAGDISFVISEPIEMDDLKIDSKIRLNINFYEDYIDGDFLKRMFDESIKEKEPIFFYFFVDLEFTDEDKKIHEDCNSNIIDINDERCQNIVDKYLRKKYLIYDLLLDLKYNER